MILKRQDWPPGLNGKDGLLRMHWSNRKPIKEKLMWLIREQKLPRASNPCSIRSELYTISPMDWDNFAAMHKLLFDAVKLCKIIEDDSPEYVLDFTMKQIRVHKKVDELFVVSFMPATPVLRLDASNDQEEL